MTRPVVVILGAGIAGRALAAELANRATVVVADVALPAAEEAAAAVTAAGGAAEAVSLDLTDLTAVTGLAALLLAQHGHVDAVVHLVGGWRGGKTLDAGALDHWAALSPGLLTTVQTTTVAFRDALLAAPRGRYVMVSSTSVAQPTAGNAAYAAAKAAAETWVRALAHAFRDSDARAVVIAAMALTTAAARAAEPQRSFAGWTDVADLATRIAAVLDDPAVGNGVTLRAPQL